MDFGNRLCLPPSLSIHDQSGLEGDSGTTPFVFVVALSEPSSSEIQVDYETQSDSATAGADFVDASGTLTFAPGEQVQLIVVTVAGDTLMEPDETFTVVLANPGDATIVQSSGTGTVINDDETLAGDLNSDGRVGSDDLDIVRAYWDTSVAPGILPFGDPSGDGIVTTTDLDIVRANWGACIPTADAPEEAPTLPQPAPAFLASTANESPRESAPDYVLANLRILAEASWREAVESLRTEPVSRENRALDFVFGNWDRA